MEKKNQIYLSALAMYLVVGFAGYINQISNYWVVLILSLLITGYTLTGILLEGKDFKKSLSLEWGSIVGFCALEIILTICIAIIKVPYIGFFKYFNYGVQILGFAFAFYSLIRFMISYSKVDEKIKSAIEARKNAKATKQEIVTTEQNQEVASKVEEIIAEETAVQDSGTDTSDVEVVGEEAKEPEVIGIELKQEKEIETPYMEEEI